MWLGDSRSGRVGQPAQSDSAHPKAVSRDSEYERQKWIPFCDPTGRWVIPKKRHKHVWKPCDQILIDCADPAMGRKGDEGERENPRWRFDTRSHRSSDSRRTETLTWDGEESLDEDPNHHGNEGRRAQKSLEQSLFGNSLVHVVGPGPGPGPETLGIACWWLYWKVKGKNNTAGAWWTHAKGVKEIESSAYLLRRIGGKDGHCTRSTEQCCRTG